MKRLKKEKDGSVVENMLVALIGMVIMTAFLVIIFGTFASISDKWDMRQVAREYLLVMETEGCLTTTDQAMLVKELEDCGLYNISLSGTTVSEVDYGESIYLNITGTYNDNILAFAGGISKVADHPTTVAIQRRTTAKQ